LPWLDAVGAVALAPAPGGASGRAQGAEREADAHSCPPALATGAFGFFCPGLRPASGASRGFAAQQLRKEAYDSAEVSLQYPALKGWARHGRSKAPRAASSSALPLALHAGRAVSERPALGLHSADAAGTGLWEGRCKATASSDAPSKMLGGHSALLMKVEVHPEARRVADVVPGDDCVLLRPRQQAAALRLLSPDACSVAAPRKVRGCPLSDSYDLSGLGGSSGECGLEDVGQVTPKGGCVSKPPVRRRLLGESYP